MNHWLLTLHLALVGLWLGCVLTEALFERALLVFKRHQLAATGDWTGFEATDHLQHKWGAVVLIGILSALIAGQRH